MTSRRDGLSTIARVDTKVYENLPDLRALYPDISNQYATLDKQKQGKGKVKGKGKLNLDPMDLLLKKLPLCVTREEIDELSVQFCPLSHLKVNCNCLLERIYEVEKPELVPLYASMIATLSTPMPVMSTQFVTALIDEIVKLLPKKGKDKVEKKLIYVLFIAELCTFGVAPPKLVLNVLRACLLDNAENLEAAGLLVRTCGQVLLHDKETVAMVEPLITEMDGMEREMVEEKQQQVELEVDKEKEVHIKSTLVRAEEEHKISEKQKIAKLKKKEKKEKNKLKKLNEEKDEDERKRRVKEERDAKFPEDMKEAEIDQLIADSVERRALVLKVHVVAHELDMLKIEVLKREESVGHVGLTPDERRNEEVGLDEAIVARKEMIAKLRKVIYDADYLTKKMEDDKEKEDKILEEARKVLEEENREVEEEARY